MKGFFPIILLILVGLFPFGKANGQYDLYTERILNFHADLVVDSSSLLTVTETIRVNALGIQIQRGIYRALPTKRNIQEKTFFVKYKVLSVKRDGVEESFHTARENGNYVIYIGNKDVILDRGIYVYELKYETQNQIGFFEDFDELYWNVNGNYWQFPVDTISATVQMPEGSKIIQNSCYKGFYGSEGQDCKVETLSDSSLKWSATRLTASEGLTIAVGIEKGIIQEPELPTFLQTENLLKILAGSLGFLFLLFLYKWYRYGIDPDKPTVVPLFHPPRNFSPATIGYLYNGKYSNKFVTASLVNLAVKRYLNISENTEKTIMGLLKKRVFKLTSTDSNSSYLPEEEKVLMNSLAGSSIKIDGEYNPTIYNMVTGFENKVTAKNESLIKKGNNRQKVILPFIIISLIYFTIIISSFIYLFNLNKFIFGCVLYAVVFIIYLIILTIPTLRYKSIWFWIIPLVPLLAFLIYWNQTKIIEPFNLAFFFLLVSFFFLTVFKYFVEQPDIELLKIKSEIEGFKMYLTAAESNLMKFHNPPQMTPKLFETLLPYAIVLNVDDIWGEKFENLLHKNQMNYRSSWYTGSSRSFSSSFSNSFRSSMTSSIVSASTMPSSSGSGSGGGGFSGGGGGGGGGGGW